MDYSSIIIFSPDLILNMYLIKLLKGRYLFCSSGKCNCFQKYNIRDIKI